MPEPKKGVTRAVEEPPKGEAEKSVEDQGIFSVTLVDEGGTNRFAVSSDSLSDGARDEDLIGAAVGKKPGISPAGCEEQKVRGEAVRERILLKRARAAEELTYRGMDPRRRTEASKAQGQTRWNAH